jgi:4-diphosphocytidyl-2-C-methyl-D-erythritol kinase
VRVPAKVNLSLSVGDVRGDGFHDLVTVFHAVSLFDEVEVSPADRLSLTVSGRDAGQVPVDERNLAWRAAVRLADAVGRRPDVRIHIAKDIPVAGGMAGGSADAAATLAGCAQLWDVHDRDLLFAVAAELGSDVAFPLLGGTAVGTGRGERLQAVPCAATLHWVFAFAGFGVSAGDAYRELDRQRGAAATTAGGDTDALLVALEAGDLDRVASLLHNDLQPAALALAPSLRDTLEAGAGRSDVLAGLVSGSGPTCAFLCRDAATAQALAAGLEADGVCAAARVARGPVPGAGETVGIAD